jgi:hypothetical protein
MQPDLDGTGGGYGKFAGKTVRDLSELFDRASAEPNMRSFSAVLRISREQVEARNSLTSIRLMAALCGGATVVMVVVYFVVPQEVKLSIFKGLLGCIAAFLAFGIGAISTNRASHAALVQERAIRDLALDALVKIAEDPSFVPKELDYQQKRILAEHLKRTKRKEENLRAMLG